MASIYYSILYPPKLPIDLPSFELGKPEDTWRLYLEPSVGNKPSDFKGGFIRIRNSNTEKNALYPGTGGFLDGFLPFRNPFAEYIDLVNPSESIKQPSGYNATMPVLQIDDNGQFYIDIRHEVFTLSGAPINVKYKVQVMFTNDWLSSTEDYGKGHMLFYNGASYQRINVATYFGGNLVQKGLSEWSAITRVAPVSEAKYEIQFDGNNIYSPIYEFVGSSIEEDLRNNNTPNYLKAYRINIYRSAGDEKELFVDSSDWIVGQDASNLQIRWQNVVELENNQTYIVELDIQTVWNLRKTFTYHVKTSFEASLFKGKIKVENDFEGARNKIVIEAQTPLTWGPRDNFEIDPNHFDFAKIDGRVRVEQGIDLYSKDGNISGEFIATNIKPIESLEEDPQKYILKLSGPELSIHNPIQEEYYIYAHSVPLGPERENDRIPYREDIIINPVLQSPTGEVYQTYLDSYKQKNMLDIDYLGSLTTMPTNIPSSHSFFYLEDEENRMWKTTITPTGQFTTTISHEKDPFEYLKPIYFYDSYNQVLAKPTITGNGIVELKEENAVHNYDLEKYSKPIYLNEFRFVKKVYGLELGRKTLIATQKYSAYFNNFNRKLGDWEKITENGQYYFYFTSSQGQLRLIVRHLNAEAGKKTMDRFTSTYIEGTKSSLVSNSDMYLVTEGMNPDFLPITNIAGRKVPYIVTVDERGVLVTEQSHIASATTN